MKKGQAEGFQGPNTLSTWWDFERLGLRHCGKRACGKPSTFACQTINLVGCESVNGASRCAVINGIATGIVRSFWMQPRRPASSSVLGFGRRSGFYPPCNALSAGSSPFTKSSTGWYQGCFSQTFTMERDENPVISPCFCSSFLVSGHRGRGDRYQRFFWTFPTNTTPAPNPPIGADLTYYSTNVDLDWVAFNSRLAVSFVPNPGETTALQFSYNGNHSDSLNGSTLMLTATISGLASTQWLTGIVLSYDIKWSTTASTLTDTWAYSINGGPYTDFLTNTATGNVWQTVTTPLSGLRLDNGDTITFRDTFSGAAGNNGDLDFDNIQMTSIVVPEPSIGVLAALGVGVAVRRRVGRQTGCSPRPARIR